MFEKIVPHTTIGHPVTLQVCPRILEYNNILQNDYFFTYKLFRFWHEEVIVAMYSVDNISYY
jgi:hypothetical protein